MNKTILSVGAAALCAAILVSSSGCKPGDKAADKKETKSPATKAASVPTSAEKTSFDDVTSKLDQGGNLFLYLSTEEWLKGVSGKVGDLRSLVLGLPEVKPEDQEKIEKGIGALQHVLKDSGIEQVSGVGMSSIAREPGFYHSKFIVHHYAGEKAGFLWSLFGKTPHALDGLDLLPANTALAAFSDLDIRLLWTVVTNELLGVDIPEANKALAEFPAQFAKQSGMKFDDLLNSLDGEYGLVLTLNNSNQISLPFGQNGMKIAEPGLMIIAKVKDDALFNRIEEGMKGNQQVVRVDKGDLKMRTMPFPFPLPIQLRPTVARSGDYLFIATTETLILEALAVKKGEKPGWKSSDEYKKLSQGLPTQGNSFFFLSPKFGATIAEVQKQALSQKNMSSTGSELLQKMFAADKPMYSFTVAANTDEGWQTLANGNQSLNRAALVPAVAIPGLLAAIAIPNFVKARTTAQQNACINNLRQISGAKDQWAIENKKNSSDTPMEKDLWGSQGYMKKKPVCPAGGTYTINDCGKEPTCSHAGHELPK